MAPKLSKVPWHIEPVHIVGLNKALYQTETGFHIFCADWLIATFANPPEDLHTGWHHSANESNKDRHSAILAKRMGQSPGFPDWVHSRSSTAIELKVGDNKLSPAQITWSAEFTQYHVVRDFLTFKGIVERVTQLPQPCINYAKVTK